MPKYKYVYHFGVATVSMTNNVLLYFLLKGRSFRAGRIHNFMKGESFVKDLIINKEEREKDVLKSKFLIIPTKSSYNV